jgi:hypothetical protein
MSDQDTFELDVEACAFRQVFPTVALWACVYYFAWTLTNSFGHRRHRFNCLAQKIQLDHSFDNPR